MFDLNHEIKHWRSAFADSGACSRDELQELESHLREEIAALVEAGASEQEAFSNSVRHLGDPGEVGREFAKNDRRFLCDFLAIRGSSIFVALVSLAAVMLGYAIWMKKGDGLLGVHVGSLTFGYVVPFPLALAGSYAILRAAIVKSEGTWFHDRFARHCRFLLGTIALACATGTVLGGIWAERHLGRFWGWDIKETGALAVTGCALVLYSLVTKYQLSSVSLGQASLMLSLVTQIAWFGPVVYMDPVGATVLACFFGSLVVQLSILSIPLFFFKRKLAAD